MRGMEDHGQLKQALVNATAGAISGAVSRTVTSPLDVIKIRFQVQLEPTTRWALLRKNAHSRSKYTGMLQASKDIFREEGVSVIYISTLKWILFGSEKVKGFWRGNVPALLMVMPYTAIQFTVQHKLKTLVSGSSKSEDHISISPYLSYVSGSFSGFAATVGSYPFDLIRTVLASQGEPKVYPNMRSAFVDIVRSRGARGLYAGLATTLVQIVPYAGLQFGTYDTCKRWTMKWNDYRLAKGDGDISPSSIQFFLCGVVAGTFAKGVCHPLDVVKKRFQIEGLERDLRYGARVEKSSYKGMYDAVRKILRAEGFAGLYKGIAPSIVKAAPASAVTFAAYEFFSDWLSSSVLT